MAALIKEKKITVCDILLNAGIMYGSEFSIAHDDLGYHKFFARRVTQQLIN